MLITQLESFLAVAETGSLARGSEQLFATPSALSQRIKQFESRLGFSVFIRTSRGMELSNDGNKIYTEAKKIVESIRALRSLSSSKINYKKISLGISSAIDRKFIKELLSETSFNDFEINFRIVSDDIAMQLLNKEILDTVITFDISNTNVDITTEYLGHVTFNFVSLSENTNSSYQSKSRIIVPYISQLIDYHISPLINNKNNTFTKFLYSDCYETAMHFVLNTGSTSVMDTTSIKQYQDADKRLIIDNKELVLPTYLAYKSSKFSQQNMLSAIKSSNVLNSRFINMN